MKSIRHKAVMAAAVPAAFALILAAPAMAFASTSSDSVQAADHGMVSASSYDGNHGGDCGNDDGCDNGGGGEHHHHGSGLGLVVLLGLHLGSNHCD